LRGGMMMTYRYINRACDRRVSGIGTGDTMTQLGRVGYLMMTVREPGSIVEDCRVGIRWRGGKKWIENPEKRRSGWVVVMDGWIRKERTGGWERI
jgi:hypothetical protein